MNIKKLKFKDEKGALAEYDLGALAENVSMPDGRSVADEINDLKNTDFKGSYDDLTDKPCYVDSYLSKVHRDFECPLGTIDLYISQHSEPSSLEGYTMRTADGNEYFIKSTAYDNGGIGICILETEPQFPDKTALPEGSEVEIYKAVADLKRVVGMDMGAGNAIFNEYLHNMATGRYASAFGKNTRAEGICSVAMGNVSTARKDCSIALGYNIVADMYQTALGKCNTITKGPAYMSDINGSLFVVGNGTNMARSNAFRVDTNGKVYASESFYGSGADYAEYFEWADKNINNEDRRGLLVTLDGDKIRPAEEGDWVLGAVSVNPSVAGNSYSEEWQGKYQRDVFGCRITEEKDGETVFAINPEFDPDKEYLGRNERPEWSPVGMTGQLVLIDDGTLRSGDFCKAGGGGVAVRSAEQTNIRVMKRLDEKHILAMVK